MSFTSGLGAAKAAVANLPRAGGGPVSSAASAGSSSPAGSPSKSAESGYLRNDVFSVSNEAYDDEEGGANLSALMKSLADTDEWQQGLIGNMHCGFAGPGGRGAGAAASPAHQTGMGSGHDAWMQNLIDNMHCGFAGGSGTESAAVDRSQSSPFAYQTGAENGHGAWMQNLIDNMHCDVGGGVENMPVGRSQAASSAQQTVSSAGQPAFENPQTSAQALFNELKAKNDAKHAQAFATTTAQAQSGTSGIECIFSKPRSQW